MSKTHMTAHCSKSNASTRPGAQYASTIRQWPAQISADASGFSLDRLTMMLKICNLFAVAVA